MDDLKKYRMGNIVQSHEEYISRYVNYSGNDVFGSHAYIPDLTGCIIAEGDADNILEFSIIDALTNIFNPYVYK